MKQNRIAIQRCVAELQVAIASFRTTTVCEAVRCCVLALRCVPRNLECAELRLVKQVLVETAVRIEVLAHPTREDAEFARLLKELCVAPDAESLTTAFSTLVAGVGRPLVRLRCSDCRIRAALTYMRKHSSRATLSAVDVARFVHLSPWHFERLLRRETGLTFRHYLLSVRMANAVQLLQHSVLSIKEISAAVGYAYASEFNRAFRRSFGTTPTAWRKEHTTDIGS